MLHALCVIAFAVLFSSGPVRLCCIFVKFSGFVVIEICHVGSISSAPSAQQHAGLQPVPKVTEWCDEDLQESSIKMLVSRSDRAHSWKWLGQVDRTTKPHQKSRNQKSNATNRLWSDWLAS